MTGQYDTGRVDELIDAATGVARILMYMSIGAQDGDNAQAQAYDVMFNALWKAVEGVTGENPMYLRTRFQGMSEGVA